MKLEWESIPGNELAKRAIEVAAAGRHSIFLISHDKLLAEQLADFARALGAVAEVISRRRRNIHCDIMVPVVTPTPDDLISAVRGKLVCEPLEAVKKRIESVPEHGRLELSADACSLLKKSIRAWEMDSQAVFSAVSVARTIAALEKEEEVGPEHMAEALEYSPYRPVTEEEV